MMFKAGDRLWEELRARAKKAKSLTACVGYVGRHPAKVLKWRKGDTLIADITEDTVRRGICSAKGALELFDAGVRVYQAPGLHAKIYLFGDAAVVCSANASESSMERREAGIVIKGAELPSVRAWVAQVQNHLETVALDRAVLAALAKVEPKRHGHKRRTKAASAKNALQGSTLWLMSVVAEGATPRVEQAAAKAVLGQLVDSGSVEEPSEVDWTYAVGKHVFQWVKPGDRVVNLWEDWQYSPQGRLFGLQRCILPVDLGAKFGKRRYRLALTSRGIRTHRLTPGDVSTLRGAMRLPHQFNWPEIRKAPAKAQVLLTRLLRLSKG